MASVWETASFGVEVLRVFLLSLIPPSTWAPVSVRAHALPAAPDGLELWLPQRGLPWGALVAQCWPL